MVNCNILRQEFIENQNPLPWQDQKYLISKTSVITREIWLIMQFLFDDSFVHHLPGDDIVVSPAHNVPSAVANRDHFLDFLE